MKFIYAHFLSKLIFIVKHLHLTPYDTGSYEGRSNERVRLLCWATITSGLSKFGSLLIVLVSVKYGLSYLGAERFGLWMTITSIAMLLNFTDFGISNSLVNSTSESIGNADFISIRRSLSNGFFIILAVSIVLFLFFFSVYPFVDWGRFANVVSVRSINESGPAIAIYVTIFLVSLPLSVVQRVQVGLQESWRSNLWLFFGQLFGLFGMVLVFHFGGGLTYLILAVAGIPAVVNAINFLDYFFFRNRKLCPSLNFLDIKTSSRITKVGMLFFVMQVMAIIGNATDNFIIAHFLGAAAVSPFAVMQRFVLILGVVQLFISPMWPVFGEAISRGDYKWARMALTNIFYASIVFGVISAIIILTIGNSIIRIWAGDAMIPNMSLSIGFAVYSLLAGLCGSLSVFLNNGAFLRRQAVIYIIASIVSVFLKIILIQWWRDSSGVIWATVVGYSVLFVVPALYIIYSEKETFAI